MYSKKDREHSVRLYCSSDGLILNVIFDANHFFDGLSSPPKLDSIMSISAQSVYRKFITDILKWGFGLCESIQIKNLSGEYTFSLFGVFRDSGIFVIALQSPQHLFQVYKDFMKMINEQSNLLRETQKKIIMKTSALEDEANICSSSLNEVMKINNELASTQRQLNIKNKELENAYDEIEKKNKLLEEASRTDSLTRLMNRRRIFERLEEELTRAKRYNEPLSIAMVDIDHFKNVNDNYGHQTGDMVLKTIALQLSSKAREVDSVGRYGGEEFLIIMPKTDEIGALAYAERLRAGVEYMPLENLDFHVTISIGLASYSGETLLELIDRADQKLYQAKAKGRNRVDS